MRLCILAAAAIACAAVPLSGCTAARVAGAAVTLPAKAVYHTARIGVKGVMLTGKGLYKIGDVTLDIAEGTLDTTTKLVRISRDVAITANEVKEFSEVVPRIELESRLGRIVLDDNVVKVRVEPFERAKDAVEAAEAAEALSRIAR